MSISRKNWNPFVFPRGPTRPALRLDGGLLQFDGRVEKERAKVVFASRAKVVGIGIDRVGDGFGVKVNLSEPPPADAHPPETIDDVHVCIEVVGEIRKSWPPGPR